ncbi:hypothetical protein ACFE04_001352 [Oxalis oulophora]
MEMEKNRALRVQGFECCWVLNDYHPISTNTNPTTTNSRLQPQLPRLYTSIIAARLSYTTHQQPPSRLATYNRSRYLTPPPSFNQSPLHDSSSNPPHHSRCSSSRNTIIISLPAATPSHLQSQSLPYATTIIQPPLNDCSSNPPHHSRCSSSRNTIVVPLPAATAFLSHQCLPQPPSSRDSTWDRNHHHHQLQ